MAPKPVHKRPYTTAGISANKIGEALTAAGYTARTFSLNFTTYHRTRGGRESVVRVQGASDPKRLWTHKAWKTFLREYQLNIYRIEGVLHMESTI